MNRLEIEAKWITLSAYSLTGAQLCAFIEDYLIDYWNEWEEVWKSSELATISGYFVDETVIVSVEPLRELSYLCRALTLNLFLDDNGVL